MPFAAIVLAMLPAVLDQTILATALPVDRRRPRPPHRRLVGGHRLRRRRRRDDAAVGQARRPPRAQAAARGRAAVFVAASALCGAAQDITQLIVLRVVQGAAAGGLMTLAMAAVGDLVAPARARPLPGLHRGDLRGRDDRRPADRRRPRRARELALGLPRQPAARRRRARRPAPAPAGARGRGRPTRPLDVLGRRAAGRRDHAPCMLTCIWGGDALRVGLGADPRR